jgi:REP element-mobilizing transposase RayT
VIKLPRNPREVSKSGVYHIMLRGINRQTIFEDDEDIQRLLETIARYKEICKYELYAYCIMSNHVHLLMKETEETISNAIKRISGSYVFWYNKKYERCGHLFQERYKSEAVDNYRDKGTGTLSLLHRYRLSL